VPGPSMRELLDDAAHGRFPAVDGGWTCISPWRSDVGAIVAFTGHAYIAVPSELAPALERLEIDGYGGAHAPSVVSTLAGPDGWIDSLDVVLVLGAAGRQRSSMRLIERHDLADHPRAVFARRVRDEVVVLGSELADESVLTLSRGLGGLPEIGIETNGRTDAVEMILAGAALAPSGATITASVAPGNARALRTFLKAGFCPVASVQLFQRATHSPGLPTAGGV